ncbi:MAG: hypothetical protein ACI9TH_003663 [Kiritimatiellia bacterium]|jgi:hypothetical protein
MAALPSSSSFHEPGLSKADEAERKSRFKKKKSPAEEAGGSPGRRGEEEGEKRI